MKHTDLLEFSDVLSLARSGDRRPLMKFLNSQRPWILKQVRNELDHRVAARLDPKDIVQEVLLDRGMNARV